MTTSKKRPPEEKPNPNQALLKTAIIGSECLVMVKDSKGYNYKYADLTALLGALRPLLAKNKLGVSQSVVVREEMSRWVQTMSICLETGDTFVSFVELVPIDSGKMNKAQAYGASLTYFRRYGMAMHFNVSADEDPDAAVLPGATPTEKTYDGKDPAMKESIRALAVAGEIPEDKIDDFLNLMIGATIPQIKEKLEERKKKHGIRK